MMKKKIYLTFIVALSTISAFAQLDSFKLSKYVLPEMKRKTLDFSFNINGFGQNFSNENINSFNMPILASYNYYRNSAKHQNELTVGESFSQSFYKHTPASGAAEVEYNMNNNLTINTTNRFYNPKKQFIGFSLAASSLLVSSENSNDSAKNTSSNSTINLNPMFIVGVGRVEEVQDARLAKYILDELNTSKKLAKLPTEDQILQFAALISKLKNERFFDSRIKKLYELEEVDAFLRDKGLIASNDVRTFSIINDNWDYGQKITRLSGRRFTFGIGPIINYSNFGATSDRVPATEFNQAVSELGAALDFNFVFEKPQSLAFQHSFMFDFQLQQTKINTSGKGIETSDESRPQFNTNLSYIFGYYPDTRTSMSFGLGLNYWQSFGKIESSSISYTQYLWQIYPTSNLNISYYFSPQLRFSASAGLTYKFYEANNHQTTPNDVLSYGLIKGFTHNFNAGFTYSFF